MHTDPKNFNGHPSKCFFENAKKKITILRTTKINKIKKPNDTWPRNSKGLQFRANNGGQIYGKKQFYPNLQSDVIGQSMWHEISVKSNAFKQSKSDLKC